MKGVSLSSCLLPFLAAAARVHGRLAKCGRSVVAVVVAAARIRAALDLRFRHCRGTANRVAAPGNGKCRRTS